MDELFATRLLGTDVTLLALGYVVLAILIGLAVASLIQWVMRRATQHAPATSIVGAVVNALDGPLRWSVIVAAVWIAYEMMVADDAELAIEAAVAGRVGGFDTRLFFVTELPIAVWFGLRLTDGLMLIWSARAKKTENTFDDQVVPVVRTLLKIAVVMTGVISIIQNLGGEVGSLLAGLGIGGAAIALASKDTIANLFGSIVIFVDRPFQVGDWVEISGQEGTVEEVGLRVTRIRTFANSLITVPNSQLTTSAINNWSKMHKRRIKLTIGVTYGSSVEQIEAGVAAIREILTGDERFAQDFMLVNFTDFGASSLDIFVYAFTTTTDWAEYMQIRQEFLLEVMRRFEAIGLSFAFPSQSLYIESLPEGAS